MAHDHVILSHLGRCPERDGEEVRIKLCLRTLDSEARIALKRQNRRRRDYKPPYYLKERYECPYGQSGACGAVREDSAACPVYQAYRYPALVE